MGFHKLAAISAVFWVTVHATCQFPALVAGWQVYYVNMLSPNVQPGEPL